LNRSANVCLIHFMMSGSSNPLAGLIKNDTAAPAPRATRTQRADAPH
jgi:hypothetical protein